MFCIVLSCILAKFMISFDTFMIDIFREQTCSDKTVQMFEIKTLQLLGYPLGVAKFNNDLK